MNRTSAAAFGCCMRHQLQHKHLMMNATRTHATLSWGSASEGKLGLGDIFVPRPTPTPITDLTGMTITALSAGVHHSAAIVSEPSRMPNTHTRIGTVRAWGSNFYGQIGYLPEYQGSLFRTDDDVLGDPKRIYDGIEDENVVQIACGDYHNVVLTDTGRVVTWGAGLLGRGDEVFESRPFPVQMFGKDDAGVGGTGLRVQRIGARHGLTFVLAARVTDAVDDSVTSPVVATEAFIWGHYTADSSGRRVKSTLPAAVPINNRLESISLASASRNNIVFQGVHSGCTTYLVYGARHDDNKDHDNGGSDAKSSARDDTAASAMPYHPMLEKVDIVNDVAPLELVATLSDAQGESAPREIHVVGKSLLVVRENGKIDIKDLMGRCESRSPSLTEPVVSMAVSPLAAAALTRSGRIFEWRLAPSVVHDPPPISFWAWLFGIKQKQRRVEPDTTVSVTDCDTVTSRAPTTMDETIATIAPSVCGHVPGATIIVCGWDHFLVYTPKDLASSLTDSVSPLTSKSTTA